MTTVTFDILYAPVCLFPPVTVHVMARGFAASDRTTALIRWLRDEIGLPMQEVIDRPGESLRTELPCGCTFFVIPETGKRKPRFRRQETWLEVHVEGEPCEQHEMPGYGPDVRERDHHDWNGTFVAWEHDPRRQDKYEVE